MLPTDTSFDDSTLVGVHRHDKDLTLSFENVYVDGTLRFAELKLSKTTKILCDGEPTEAFEMVEQQGEILELAEVSGQVSLLISWLNLKKDTEEERSYEITCESIITTIGSISPDNPFDNSHL